ncbi:MAG TPA: hypothetical protein DDZ89_06405, partial [Clostridiales bacterium]|nr:hypothetical protein [Clostridiales bacterium]
GEVTANTALTREANLDGDDSTDLISIKYDSTKATLTVYFEDGTLVTKSIGHNSDVSWASPYLLTTGDFDRDGKSEIVFAPAIFGSNYGAKDLYILRLEDNKLVEMPQNYVEDTTIKDIPSKTLNYEYMCINISVIDTDDGQLLRIRYLINPHENTAWYVDVFWNGQAWQVENISVGFAYGE